MKGTRHNQMQRLRQSGRTLQYIGDKFGLSRERVRQILVERYGSTKATQMLSRSKVAKKLNCAKSRLIKLEKMQSVPG
jgi:DNA-directed RNA polymerase sigma subunit (sigma70/sigma32)